MTTCFTKSLIAMQNSFRGTGRTTRMLNEAKELVDSGKNVCVVGLNLDHCQQLRRAYIESHGPFGDQLLFLPIESRQIERSPAWGVLRVRGRDATVLIDHYAIESEFRHVLAMLHRWDKQTDTAQASQAKWPTFT